MNFESLYKKVERTLGGMKFAVIVILIFTGFMIAGTFLESYYGTEFAARTVYKKFPFMFVQFLMMLSIIFATLIRLPFKKRLKGFYVIHTGLVMIGCGAFITWVAGIDGNITLAPNEPSRHVVLSDDIFRIQFKDEGKQVTYKLPNTAFKTELNEEYKGAKLLDYLPYADPELQWVKEKNIYPNETRRHSSSYAIYNKNVSQDFILTSHPEGQEFQSTLSMGLLNMQYLPKDLAKCFGIPSKSKLIVWNAKTNECFTPEMKNIEIKKTKSDVRFFAFKEGEEVISFFPDVSPWAFDDKITPIKNSQYRVFSKGLFEEKPHLFLFGKKAAFYDKDLETPKWVIQSFDKNNSMKLPWMDFTLQLLRHEDTLLPTFIPIATYPIQKGTEMIRGNLRALRLKIRDEEYWVTNERPLRLLIDGKEVIYSVEKETIKLPFEIVLSKFKMEKNPGTETPASYESFVTLFTNKGPESHHVYMNNPMKHSGFTFYQASYWQDPKTKAYGSTLSVNVDQGRFLKYLGSLLLVIGAMWHYLINRRELKIKVKNKLFQKNSEENK